MQRTATVSRLVALGALLSAASAPADVVDTRELTESFTIDARAPLVVVVKNVIGSVRVTGHDADRVEMRATETVRGDLQADIARAREEVRLETAQEPGRVVFRVRHDRELDGRWSWDEPYRVEYEIELRVPRAARLELATVAEGDLTAEGVSGDFSLRNVNGAVRLSSAGGSGSITTVNGDVEASFERAPSGPMSFKTVNGDVDVTFPEALSAELGFATMNGDVYTDFEVVALSPPPPQPTRKRGMSFVRTNRNSAFRIGSGGDRHTFNTLNGSIYVRKAKS
jgi:hypothetical protein